MDRDASDLGVDVGPMEACDDCGKLPSSAMCNECLTMLCVKCEHKACFIHGAGNTHDMREETRRN